MQRTPLVPVALALIAGIAGQHWLPGMATWCCLAIMLVAALAAGILLVTQRKIAITTTFVLITICIAGIGGTLGRRYDPAYNQYHWTKNIIKDDAYLSVKLTDTPQPRKRSWSAKAKVESVDGKPTEGAIRLFFRKDATAETLRYGDKLLIHCYPDVIHGSTYTTSDHYFIIKRDSTSLRAKCEALRMKLLVRMQAGPLGRNEAGIAEAMTLGWRADIDPATQASFRDAGIAHLLAVSGLHVGLLAAIVGGLLFWVNKERKGRIVRGVVQLAAVWLFTFLTGLAPATTRAALMFSLLIISNILGRRTPKMNLLAATAIATLAASPMLLFDIGWQLSYSAVVGILLAQPVIQLYHNKIWQASAVSIAATLATLPITLAAFHRIQLYFLIANVLIVPLAGLILAFALLYMALHCMPVAQPLEWLLQGANWLTDRIGALPGAVVETSLTNSWTLLAVSAIVLILLLSARHIPIPEKQSY